MRNSLASLLDRFMEEPCHSHSSFHLPDNVPVMVLGDCYLFPGCLLPLFIFEERYRLMLAHALKTDRMFCIGTRVRNENDQYEMLPVSTVGLIRACKRQEDGTSHVMLQGMRRIRFKDWHQEKPFVIADIEPMPTLIQTDPDHVNALKRRSLELLPDATACAGEAMRSLRAALQKMDCPDLVCDILAYHYVRNTSAQQRLLVEPVLEKRYEILINELKQAQAEHEEDC